VIKGGSCIDLIYTRASRAELRFPRTRSSSPEPAAAAARLLLPKHIDRRRLSRVLSVSVIRAHEPDAARAGAPKPYRLYRPSCHAGIAATAEEGYEI
jgi:hypothetical protein